MGIGLGWLRWAAHLAYLLERVENFGELGDGSGPGRLDCTLVPFGLGMLEQEAFGFVAPTLVLLQLLGRSETPAVDRAEQCHPTHIRHARTRTSHQHMHVRLAADATAFVAPTSG